MQNNEFTIIKISKNWKIIAYFIYSKIVEAAVDRRKHC
jgi:hypothetical protein